MIVVLIVPTGLGAEIGGHAGDANPVAKLLGACCDKLITHPNVVNGSDINEMPENALYVEGSILDRFLSRHFLSFQERKKLCGPAPWPWGNPPSISPRSFENLQWWLLGHPLQSRYD